MKMDRTELKRRAREQLGGRIFGSIWLRAVVVMLVYLVLNSGNLFKLGFGKAAGGAVGIGLSFLLGGPLEYAVSGMFLRQCRDGGEMNYEDLLSGFQNGFGQLFVLDLMRSLLVTLWSLLFVIPGIVAECSYSMSFFIRADHPEYSWQTCLQQSKKLMEGHKMEYFVLQLSFLGWKIVGTLCLGVGLLWVESYFYAAKAQFYAVLCQQERSCTEPIA